MDESKRGHFLIRTKRTKNRSSPHFYPVEATEVPQTLGNLVSMHEELGARARGAISDFFFPSSDIRRKVWNVFWGRTKEDEKDEKIRIYTNTEAFTPCCSPPSSADRSRGSTMQGSIPATTSAGFSSAALRQRLLCVARKLLEKRCKMDQHGRVRQSDGKELHQNPLLKWRRICFCFTPRARAPLGGLQKAPASGDEKDVLGFRSGHRAAAHSSS